MSGAFHQGIEYASLESIMRMRGVANMAQRFDQIRHIEAGALSVMNKR